MNYKVIIAGGRDFNNYKLLEETMTNLSIDIDEIVVGGAKGADTLGLLFARNNNHKVKSFPADWSKSKKLAGFIRNDKMAKYADVLVAFWNGKSKGTKHMIEVAKLEGLIIHEINY